MKRLLPLLLIPFLFAGTFQSYTEKTAPESSDIFLILDNDDLTTKKVQVGNIGDGINWDSVNIQSGGINWTSLDQDIQKDGVNWASLDRSIAVSGINWFTADMAIGGASNNMSIGTTDAPATLTVSSSEVEDLFIVNDSGVGDTSPFVVTSAGNVGIGTTYSDNNKLFVIGGTYIQANVGIGTTIPSTKLVVEGNAKVGTNSNDRTGLVGGVGYVFTVNTNGVSPQDAVIGASVNDDSAVIFGDDSTYWMARSVNDGAEAVFGVTSAGEGVVQTFSASDLLLRVNNADAVWVKTGTSNVGVGTANPEAKLVVNGLIVPDRVTADPCSSGAPAGGAFYNNTGNFWCYCNGSNDVKMSDDTTACF